jgi:hypothetical protein
MLSFDSATQIIATSTYYIDDLCGSEESFLEFINGKLPYLTDSEKPYLGHIDKKTLLFDAAFRTKSNVEYQLLIQQEYILFSRYAIIKYFGNEKKAYCNLSAFSTREIFPDFDKYIKFVRGEDPILDIGISGQSLVRWILKCLRNVPLGELERQIICYEINQLADHCQLQVPEDKLFDILKLRQLNIISQSSYAQLVEQISDFGFLIWKSYFRGKPNYFYQQREEDL